MMIVHEVGALREYMRVAVNASPEHPVLIDRFLADATEVDVDAICDGERVVIGGIMEHIEEAGVHSGDSACSIPPYSLAPAVTDQITRATRALALELGVRGLMNVQYAVKDDAVYVLEVNPRASRTVPFVSKAIGVPLAKLAALVMAGRSLDELGFTREVRPPHFSVKEAVFPFVKFPGVDTLLGPEMKSTGEVMGIDADFGRAYAKAQIEAGNTLPTQGTVLVSVRAEDRGAIGPSVRELARNGFRAGDAGHGRALEALGSRRDRAKVGRLAGRRRPHREGRGRSGDQHGRQRAEGRAGLDVDAPRGADARRAVLHHRRRRARRHRRNPRDAGRVDRRALVAGDPRHLSGRARRRAERRSFATALEAILAPLRFAAKDHGARGSVRGLERRAQRLRARLALRIPRACAARSKPRGAPSPSRSTRSAIPRSQRPRARAVRRAGVREQALARP
jgi:hypothetical protein